MDLAVYYTKFPGLVLRGCHPSQYRCKSYSNKPYVILTLSGRYATLIAQPSCFNLFWQVNAQRTNKNLRSCTLNANWVININYWWCLWLNTDEILRFKSSDCVKFIVNVNYTCPYTVYHTHWFFKWQPPFSWNYEVGSADEGDDGDDVDFEHPDSDGSLDFQGKKRQ